MEKNINRRKFLSIATSVTSAVGGIFAVGAFVSTFQPSKKAKALGASIKVNLSKLEPGSIIKVIYRGKPIWVLRRTEKMINELDEKYNFTNTNEYQGNLYELSKVFDFQIYFAKERDLILFYLGNKYKNDISAFEKLDFFPETLKLSEDIDKFLPKYKSGSTTFSVAFNLGSKLKF